MLRLERGAHYEAPFVTTGDLSRRAQRQGLSFKSLARLTLVRLELQFAETPQPPVMGRMVLKDLRTVPPNKQNMMDRITINPAVCGGRPCIRGLRIRVTDVLDLLASDVPREEILEDFPYLEAEDITACLQFAAARANHPIFQSAS